MKSRDGLIREHLPGDEIRIMKLFQDTIGLDRKIAQWRWQFPDNIHGEGWITLAESNGEIIGQYCMMHIPLNFLGCKQVAGQSCDTLVRPDHQGKGWFVKLARRNYEYAAQKGVEAVLGMPGRNSYPGFMRDLGWERITELKYYFYRLEFHKLKKLEKFGLRRIVRTILSLPDRVVSRMGLLQSGSGVDIKVESALPDDLSPMLLEINNHEVLSLWKDLDYLIWRYERHPVFQYKFHVLRVHGRPEALIVSRDCGDSIKICEMLSRTKNAAQATLLLRQALRYFYGHSSSSRVEFYGHDTGFFETVFGMCRFKMQPRSSIIFGGRAFRESRLKQMFQRSDNWTVSYGDCDFI